MPKSEMKVSDIEQIIGISLVKRRFPKFGSKKVEASQTSPHILVHFKTSLKNDSVKSEIKG